MQPTQLFVIALGILLFALFSRRAEAGSVTAPMTFTAFGFLIGAGGLGLVDLSVQAAAVQDLAEVTLVLALFTDAARIDLTRLNREHDIPMRLLGLGLPLSIVAGGAVAFLLFPSLTFWGAVTLGVILAPTDAALGQAVVSNEKVPPRIRQALNVESGLNDGLAFPALLVAASLATAEAGRGAVGWAGFAALQLTLGPLVGLAVGFVGAFAVELAERKGSMNAVFLRISTLALALLAYAGAELVSGNGFIAAFVAGLVVGTRSRRLLDGVEDFGETEGQLLTLLVFLIFGAVLLPDALDGLTWRHAVYAALSLTVIRMVPVAVSLVGCRLRYATVGFIGWFGPRGLASIIYLLLLLEEGYEIEGIHDIRLTVLATVVASIVLHGLTASPFAHRYGDLMRRLGPEAEHRSVFPFPTRLRTAREKAAKVPERNLKQGTGSA